MVKENIRAKMEGIIREDGSQAKDKVTASRHGKMDKCMRDNLKMVTKMEMANLFLKIKVITKENLSKTRFTEKVASN